MRKFRDLSGGYTVLAKYKEAEYSAIFQIKVWAKSPNNKYLLLEYKDWSKDFEASTRNWDSVERLDSIFEIVDDLGIFNPWY